MQHIEETNLVEIWQLAQSGAKASAQKKVRYVLETHPQHIPAWLLLAEIVVTSEEKSRCYRHILTLDPQNQWATAFFNQQMRPLTRTKSNSPAIPSLFEDESDRTYLSAIEMEDIEDRDMVESTDGAQDTDEALTQYVIQESGRHADEDDIIREVSLRCQINWYDAEKLVNGIQLAHALTIAKRRSPLQLFIAIPTLIGGVGWFIWTILNVISTKGDLLTVTALLAQSYGQLLSSMAMILGSTLGLYRIMKSLGKIKIHDL